METNKKELLEKMQDHQEDIIQLINLLNNINSEQWIKSRVKSLRLDFVYLQNEVKNVFEE